MPPLTHLSEFTCPHILIQVFSTYSEFQISLHVCTIISTFPPNVKFLERNKCFIHFYTPTPHHQDRYCFTQTMEQRQMFNKTVVEFGAAINDKCKVRCTFNNIPLDDAYLVLSAYSTRFHQDAQINLGLTSKNLPSTRKDKGT